MDLVSDSQSAGFWCRVASWFETPLPWNLASMQKLEYASRAGNTTASAKWWQREKWKILQKKKMGNTTHVHPQNCPHGGIFSSVPTQKHCGSSNLFQKQILAHRPSCVHPVPSCALYPFINDGKFINEDAVGSQLDQTQKLYIRNNSGSWHWGAKHEKKSWIKMKGKTGVAWDLQVMRKRLCRSLYQHMWLLLHDTKPSGSTDGGGERWSEHPRSTRKPSGFSGL